MQTDVDTTDVVVDDARNVGEIVGAELVEVVGVSDLSLPVRPEAKEFFLCRPTPRRATFRRRNQRSAWALSESAEPSGFLLFLLFRAGERTVDLFSRFYVFSLTLPMSYNGFQAGGSGLSATAPNVE